MMTSEKDFPSDTDREYIASCHKQLCDNAAEIRTQLRENQEIRSSNVLTVIRHILDHNLIDPLYEYAATSVTDTSDPPSRAAYALLTHLMLGKKLDYDTHMLLKTGLAALLHYADIHDLPDRILQEDCILTPDEISDVRARTAPSLDLLTGFADRLWTVSPQEAGEPKEEIKTQTALTPEELAAIRKD